MRLHRFQKISRTGRGKSAAAVRTAKQTKQRRKRALIEANDKTNQSEHQSRIEARLARRNHSSSNASYLAVAASCLAIITNQTPRRSSCWCRRTISRKRRRTRLRTTAPPRRPEVTNPARHGPEFSTGIAFNIRSLPRCVMPSRFTRSYSERCVRRHAFGKENEPAGAILIGNPLSHAARSQDVAFQKHLESGRPRRCDFSTKEVFHRNSGGRLLEKKNAGNLLPGRLSRCFLGASRRLHCRSSWSFGCSGTCLSRCRRSGGGRSCRRSDSFGFLFTSREKRGTGQNADVFLHS